MKDVGGKKDPYLTNGTTICVKNWNISNYYINTRIEILVSLDTRWK